MAFIVAVAIALAAGAPAVAQPLIKVRLDVTRVASGTRDSVQGGGIIITEPGRARVQPRAETHDQRTRTRQTTGVFTLVRSGGEAMLTVATQVPYGDVAFFQNYATAGGYVPTGIVFKDVGTSIKVGAVALPDDHIRVRLTPVISYLAGDGAGRIEMIQAATDLAVRNGQPVLIGGASTRLDTVTRRILGFVATNESSDATLTLTATIE